MKCKRSKDGCKIDHHTLEVLRQKAIKAVREGQTVTRVTATFGLNVCTVFNWLAKYSDGGDALLAKPIPGRPGKVRDEEMAWIAQAIRDLTPKQFGLEYGLWILSLIAKLIDRQFGKAMSLAAVSLIMKLLDFSV